MKKRAAVARALAMDPEILFFDERPRVSTLSLPRIDQLILDLKQAFRMTIIVVTHELASAFLIADRMVLINKEMWWPWHCKEMQNSTHPGFANSWIASPNPPWHRNSIICRC